MALSREQPKILGPSSISQIHGAASKSTILNRLSD